MARIRSIHPGIWTDEEFASLPMAARVLYFGLLTEADDNGIFEWKPTGLKMRIFPADKIDIDPLMIELYKGDKIDSFEIEGRKYGAIRNFRKYQRPKKPNTRFPLPEDWRIYVGLGGDDSEPVENQFGTGGEISPQMEEEGGRRKEEKKDTARAVYAFEHGVIKLNQKDFDQWKSSFSHLDIPAELIALSPWAEQQGKNWFHAVPNALAKRNREAKAAKDRPSPGGQKWLDGIEGVI
jgi:hypothetical protein